MDEWYFLEFGYSKNDFEKIKNNYYIKSLFPSTLIKHFVEINNVLLGLGHTKEEIINMCRVAPSIYTYTGSSLLDKIGDFINLGYSKKDIVKMANLCPYWYCYSIDNIMHKIQELVKLGYSMDDVIRMSKIFPSLYSYSIYGIKSVMQALNLLGYTNEEIIDMSLKFPSILGRNPDSLYERFIFLMNFDFTKEEIISMTIKVPSIYSMSDESLKDKINLYDSMNLRKVIILEPRHLIQSSKLTSVRYKFYLSKNININDEYYAPLFYTEKRFMSKYNITNKELIEIYTDNNQRKR